jgi:hypothetical protein
MDAAVAAAMSDPERNPAFRRRWQETCTPQQRHDEVPRPAPDMLELTGRALVEQWRRERARRGVAP